MFSLNVWPHLELSLPSCKETVPSLYLSYSGGAVTKLFHESGKFRAVVVTARYGSL